MGARAISSARRPELESLILLYGLLSTELYLLLVRERGWTREQWEQWAYDILRLQLCSG